MVIASILFLAVTPIGMMVIASTLFLAVTPIRMMVIVSILCLPFTPIGQKLNYQMLMQYAFSAPNEIYLHQSI
jgi:hypothetical protein